MSSKSAINPKRRYTFVLKNIDLGDVQEIDGKKSPPPPSTAHLGSPYALSRQEDENVMTYESSDVEYEPSTSVSDIPRCIQEKRRMIVTMHDVQRNVIMPLATDIPCWWCRYEFSSTPLGAPLVYHPNSADDPKIQKEIDRYFRALNIQSKTNDYFETEGVFCSLPCMKAFVLNEPLNGHFKNSLTLLTLLHSKLCGKKTCSYIPRAPHWKLLEKHGGILNIEQFRNAYPRFTYRSSVNMKRPFMFGTGTWFEQIERVVV